MLMNSYETVNDILVKLFNEIMDVEERALITSEYKDISVNDMHVIEAIGIREPKNMSTVARAVSVTVGTLTIAINHLVKKGYVERSRSEEDRRVVLVSLSEKGEKAYFHHRSKKSLRQSGSRGDGRDCPWEGKFYRKYKSGTFDGRAAQGTGERTGSHRT